MDRADYLASLSLSFEQAFVTTHIGLYTVAWMSDYALDLRVWDVTDSSATYIHTGQRDIVIDCGATEGFSPAKWIRHEYGRTNLDYMIISHPHHDHIEDLGQFKKQGLRPSIIQRPKKARSIIEEKLEDARENDNQEYIEDAEYYLELDEFSGDPDPSPSEPEWVGLTGSSGYRTDGGTNRGVTFHNYSTQDPSLGNDHWETLNNLSKITVVNSFGFKYISTGDLLEDGINEMMESDSAMSAMEDADVLMAPHHGREESFNRDFVEHINPDIVIFSDKGDVDNTATESYSDVANGKGVTNEETGETEERYVLTTRANGRIRIEANNDEDWRASFYGKDYAETIAASRNYKRIGKYD